MIYEKIDIEIPIRQGHIFRGVPRVDFSLSSMAIIDENDLLRKTTWRDLLVENGDSTAVTAVLPMKSVDAIVITQNCDNMRGEYICLCQIDNYLDVLGIDPPSTPKKWQSLITKHSHDNLRLFYLPADSQFSFNDRRAVDFRIILRIKRVDLESLKKHRVCRLNDMATEHFRETMAQFFRRYPYDEWYTLTKEEFDEYSNLKQETIKPFPWQE